MTTLKLQLVSLVTGESIVAQYDEEKSILYKPVQVNIQPTAQGMNIALLNYGFPFLVAPEGVPLKEISINKDAVLWAVQIEGNKTAEKLVAAYRKHISPISLINASGLIT